ncbi:MAG: HlyD family secretion protein [Verrucomicrobiales bacterium]|jgi:HlyD family secretion protein
MKSLRKKLFWLLVLALVAGAAIFASRPAPAEVDLAEATLGDLTVTVDEDGMTRIRERYVVSTPLAGRLVRVTLKPGDEVKAGETLITTLEPTDPQLLDARAKAQAEARVRGAEAAQKQAQSQVAAAEKKHQLAVADAERAARLYKKNGTSQQNYEHVQFEAQNAAVALNSVQLAVQIAEFEAEQARAALLLAGEEPSDSQNNNRFQITAPIDGRVLRVFQESSTVVQAGERLVELGDPQDLEVAVDVLSTDAIKIVSGASVRLEHWGGDGDLKGKVRLVEPSAFTKISALGVEEQRVWVIIDLVDPTAIRSTLGDAYRVEARITTANQTAVVKVPAGALFRKNQETWAVFVAEDETAVLKEVQRGQTNGIETEITAGLSAGEKVILHPSDQIDAGVGIRPR